MIEATDFRNAMSLLTTAVNVITTEGVAGIHGFTASEPYRVCRRLFYLS